MMHLSRHRTSACQLLPTVSSFWHTNQDVQTLITFMTFCANFSPHNINLAMLCLKQRVLELNTESPRVMGVAHRVLELNTESPRVICVAHRVLELNTESPRVMGVAHRNTGFTISPRTNKFTIRISK